VTLTSAPHSKKTLLPIHLTEDGMQISQREEQQLNASI
jgi:hypothetical protein